MVEKGIFPGDHIEDGIGCPVCGGRVWVLGRIPRSEPPEYRLGCKEAWNPGRKCPVQRGIPEGIVVVEDVTDAA